MTVSQESAPSSRPSLADPPQQGPMPLFEYHLKCLSDSYLSFFQERVKIEETFIDSLYRLHKKSKSIDNYLDERGDPTTVRHVWAEIRDGIEREAQTREAFLSALTKDVIAPLSALRETQDRTRKRIKEDIKDSALAYQEYADHNLPRAKRAYLKKCQEVEDNKNTLNASTSSPPTQFESPAMAPSRSNPGTGSAPITSPQPLRPLARRPSGHHPQPRNRSPSSTNPLQDLAHQGKRQLNQLMTFLDNKGGVGRDALASVKGDNAVRTVKAKREADEADKEYRKSIHWLETLRIRRVKILEGAFKSLELFVAEIAQTMKIVLDKYCENAIATTTTQTHLVAHAKDQIVKISLERDTALLPFASARYLQQAVPKQTLYSNYHIGECNDLIFGVALVDYANSRSLQEGGIPKIVKLCIQEVDSRGLNCEGIYRVSGRLAAVQALIHKIEKDEKNFQLDRSDDVFVVASLLKQYLRELPEPLFKFPLEERVKHTEDLEEHVMNNFLFLRGKIRRLPQVHQATLKAVVEHLARVAANSEKNKMDAKNLAIIFGGVVFGEEEIPKASDLLNIQNWKDSLMEDLINHAHILFDDRQREGSNSSSPPSVVATADSTPATSTTTLNTSAMSHPLPPAPAGEESANTDFLPAFTQAGTMLHRRRGASESNVHFRTPSEPSLGVPHGLDFTPQLPPRPGNSIHPSRRTGGQTSRPGIPPVPGRSYSPSAPNSPERKKCCFGGDVSSTPLPNPHPEPRDSIDSTVSHVGSIVSNGDEPESTRIDTPVTDDTFATAQGTPPSPLTPGEDQSFDMSSQRKSHDTPRSLV